MNNVNLLIGVRFPVLLKMLIRNGFSLYPKYIIRLLLLLFNAILSSLFQQVERKKYSTSVNNTVLSNPPVFIIGHWRTGSTYLHQLFNLDPQFTTPKLIQTAIPDHFLFSSTYYLPLMNLAMPKSRMMDEVTISPLAPQEDEFALIRMGSESPLEKLFFPTGDKYFLADYNEYIPKGDKLELWKQNLLTFYKKITFLTGKQIVSKNPYHTMRMSLLADMFPGARFIHICRSPYEVIPSTVRMWNKVAKSTCLKRTWTSPGFKEVASVLRSYIHYVSKEKTKCREHHFTEVTFENLEKDPLKELKRIYAELNLNFSEIFENKVIRFLSFSGNYIKNTYRLTEEEKYLIQRYFEDPITEDMVTDK
ncbi:MAG: sulfotransferase [Bacteroidales bacterium]|nr:sulfotransferase [Bacteroidales bacterium]